MKERPTTVPVMRDTKIELDLIKAKLQITHDELLQLLVKYYKEKMEV